jgi:tetratricopeptide (TPR) repeat protein
MIKRFFVIILTITVTAVSLVICPFIILWYLISTKIPSQRFWPLNFLTKMTFRIGMYKKAQRLALELLTLAESHRNNWNYGNAIFDGNIILGKISVKKGDINVAKEYLIKAGKTPGSPQLNSYGPDWSLAKELLKIGEKEVVLDFIESCRRFYNNSKLLDRWVEYVKTYEVTGSNSNKT